MAANIDMDMYVHYEFELTIQLNKSPVKYQQVFSKLTNFTEF